MPLKLIKKIFLIIVPLFFIIVFYFVEQPFKVFLLDRTEYYVDIVGDAAEGGTTVISGGLQDDNGYILNYTLGKGYAYPYANIYINKNNGDFLDFSKHEYIKIDVKSSSSNYLEIRAYLYIEGITNKKIHSTFVPISYILPVTDRSSEYSVKINDLEIPHWWYSSNSSTKLGSIKKYLDSVIYFEVSHTSDKELKVEDTITLSSLYLEKSDIAIVVKIILFLVIYLLLIYIYKYQKLGKKRNITIPYTKLKIDNKPIENQLIEDYIGENYSDPNICMTKVSEVLNMSAKSISDYIHKKFDLTFPSYLNSIRITEAKRLLLNNDLKILDIAISVGYNSAGHFNRIFKQFENMTPTEFRKK